MKPTLRSRLSTLGASVVFAATLVPLAGCGSSADPPPEGSHVVEIFSWWTAGGEKEALDALLAYYARAHADETVINAAEESADSARQRLEQRIKDGAYPDTFQLNAGIGLRDWAARTDSGGKTLLRSLDSLPDAPTWKANFPQAVLDAVSVDGKLYAVPVNVHRNNSLFYNKKIFDDNHITPPTNLTELFQVADTLSKLPNKVIPFALASKDPWPVSLLVWENLMIARNGPQYFVDFFTGKKGADDPGLRATLEDAVTFFQYTDPTGRNLLWDEAVAQVESGAAAMTIMGDWAKGHFETAHKTPDVDFVQMATPGSGDAFVYNPDCFPLMAGGHNADGAISLLSTFASVGGQDVFNPIKGSIPARTDADTSQYDVASQRTIADFRTKQLVLSTSGLIPTAVSDALDHSMATFIDSHNVDDVIQVVRDNYPNFKP